MKTALIQSAPSVGDKEKNLREMERIIVENTADLYVFPELYLSGYNCKDEITLMAEPLEGKDATSVAAVEELARDHNVSIIFGMAEKAPDTNLYNSAVFVSPGGYMGAYRKWFLANFFPFQEMLYFRPGSQLPLFDTPIGKLGIIICFDLFNPELCSLYAKAGANIIVCISASPTFSRYVFETVGPARAIENTVFFLYCNLTGLEERLMFWGGNYAISPRGSQLAKGEYFKEQAVIFDMDEAEIEVARQMRPTLRGERIGDLAQCYKRLWKSRFEGFP